MIRSRRDKKTPKAKGDWALGEKRKTIIFCTTMLNDLMGVIDLSNVQDVVALPHKLLMSHLRRLEWKEKTVDC